MTVPYARTAPSGAERADGRLPGAGLRVDEQMTRVFDRLQPHRDRICDLIKQPACTGGGAKLHIVRCCNDTDPARPGTADAQPLGVRAQIPDALDLVIDREDLSAALPEKHLNPVFVRAR